MQQLQQMRMLQSLGQYSQLGLSSFNSPFGQNYSNPGLESQQAHVGINDRDYQEQKHEYDHIPHGKSHGKSVRVTLGEQSESDWTEFRNRIYDNERI